MAILAQGTQVYYVDPDTGEVNEVECAISFNPGGDPTNPLQTTCLADFAHSYVPGLRTPSQATMGIQFDPQSESHIRIFELAQLNPSPTLQFAIGFSDGFDIQPTVDSSGDMEFPATRSWYVFEGYFADVPFDFQLDSVVTSEVTIQRSGSKQVYPRVPV